MSKSSGQVLQFPFAQCHRLIHFFPATDREDFIAFY